MGEKRNECRLIRFRRRWLSLVDTAMNLRVSKSSERSAPERVGNDAVMSILVS
jgi:hypothetical protein